MDDLIEEVQRESRGKEVCWAQAELFTQPEAQELRRVARRPIH